MKIMKHYMKYYENCSLRQIIYKATDYQGRHAEQLWPHSGQILSTSAKMAAILTETVSSKLSVSNGQ